MDKTIEGVECRIGDKDYLDNVTISIKGTYKNYLFKNDTFKGTIEIDKYDFTKNGASVLLEFLDGAGALTYFNFRNGEPELDSLGRIFCNPSFDKVLIFVFEPIAADSSSWSADNGLFISAPSATREEAIEIPKSFSDWSKWIH
ncbi:MAG TPA: hypothetical protein VHQ24_04080 [Lachnospiraceae bacterium]|nr:hypothetical protein [Lachnospiraceae bacterium]